MIYNKYFKNRRSFRRRVRSEYYSIKNNQISKYDDLIKKYAKKINIDWRLLAAQIYQESRFLPNETSWAGALGLMQMMPETANSLRVTNPADPEQSLKGGTKYLQKMYDYFEDIPDKENRIKFALAAYNCGYGHVLDAQRLAKANGLNPKVWTDNVELAILDLSMPKHYTKPFIKYGYVRRKEPVAYVKQIFERYAHYKQFINLNI